MQHLKISQAGLVSAFVFVVGQLVAYIPNLAQYQSILIAAGTAVIAGVFLVANAIHALAASKISIADLEGGVEALVKGEVSKVDFNSIVHGALAGQNIGQLVQQEVARMFAALSGTHTAPAAAPGGAPAVVAAAPGAVTPGQ